MVACSHSQIMTEKEVKLLLAKYNHGLASPQEKDLLEKWYHQAFQHQELNVKDFDEDKLDLDKLKNEIWQGTRQKSGLTAESKRGSGGGRRRGYAVAAVTLMLVSIGIYLYRISDTTERTYTVAELADPAVDIKPGRNQATLTLADGRVIDLRDDKKGIVINTSSLTYNDGTEIAESGGEPGLINTITTPNGGQYHVVLPDGSRVWLNAASTLKYPSRFDAKERSVELVGEAYFEVEKMSLTNQEAAKPFIVKSAMQDVEVLGTHFNISAYEDDPITTTTLLEGAVNVRATDQPVMLTPGKQSKVQKGKKTETKLADIDKAIGWKNGEFVFYNERIEKVMKDIARWYDVEIIYKENVKDKMMWGSVSKFENISKVLKMIELTGSIRFDIEIQEDSRRVYVMD